MYHGLALPVSASNHDNGTSWTHARRLGGERVGSLGHPSGLPGYSTPGHQQERAKMAKTELNGFNKRSGGPYQAMFFEFH